MTHHRAHRAFHCDAPALCAAFIDERRVVAGRRRRLHAKRTSSPLGQCGSCGPWSRRWPRAFGAWRSNE